MESKVYKTGRQFVHKYSSTQGLKPSRGYDRLNSVDEIWGYSLIGPVIQCTVVTETPF